MAETYEFDPLTGDPLPKNNVVKVQNGNVSMPNSIASSDIAKINSMDKAALIRLVQRCNPHLVAVALMNENDIRAAFLDRLAVAGINEPDLLKAMTAIEKRLNRTEGTPVQRQAVDMRVESHSVVTHEMRIKQADEEAERIMKIVSDRIGKNTTSGDV